MHDKWYGVWFQLQLGDDGVSKECVICTVNMGSNPTNSAVRNAPVLTISWTNAQIYRFVNSSASSVIRGTNMDAGHALAYPTPARYNMGLYLFIHVYACILHSMLACILCGMGTLHAVRHVYVLYIIGLYIVHTCRPYDVFVHNIWILRLLVNVWRVTENLTEHLTLNT